MRRIESWIVSKSKPFNCSVTNISPLKTWIIFNLFSCGEKHHTHSPLWEMPDWNRVPDSLIMLNITLKLEDCGENCIFLRGSKRFRLEQQLLFHSQAPTDTFHPRTSVLLPKCNLFHIVSDCKLASAAHIAQQGKEGSNSGNWFQCCTHGVRSLCVRATLACFILLSYPHTDKRTKARDLTLIIMGGSHLSVRSDQKVNTITPPAYLSEPPEGQSDRRTARKEWFLNLSQGRMEWLTYSRLLLKHEYLLLQIECFCFWNWNEWKWFYMKSILLRPVDVLLPWLVSIMQSCSTFFTVYLLSSDFLLCQLHLGCQKMAVITIHL